MAKSAKISEIKLSIFMSFLESVKYWKKNLESMPDLLINMIL